MCARFMPALNVDALPGSLPARFDRVGVEPMRRLLMLPSGGMGANRLVEIAFARRVA